MNKNDSLFASLEDIAAASEITAEIFNVHKSYKNIFSVINLLHLINSNDINNFDNVLVLSSHVDIFSWIISYAYAPQQLITVNLNTPEKSATLPIALEQRWNTLSFLLNRYKGTKPVFKNSLINDINYKKESFEIIFASFYIFDECNKTRFSNRFFIENGTEYNVFIELMKKAAVLLKKNGKLLVLSKPCWILKSWKLIQDLSLEMDYYEYNCYIDNERNPNTYVWLKFYKKIVDFDIQKQKRNILALMKENSIDHMFAHKNNLCFPYAELSYKNSDPYIMLNQNHELMQYFFSQETTARLTELCTGYTACLATPSIALFAFKLHKNVVLFDIDARFKEKDGVTYIKYNLKKGLTKFIAKKYNNKFNTLICDPPFNIDLDILAKDIIELIKYDRDSTIYIVFPDNRKQSLIRAMKNKGLSLYTDNFYIELEYAKPPKTVRINGKKAIQLYKFKFI